METKRIWMQGRAPQKRLSTLQVLLHCLFAQASDYEVKTTCSVLK
jgi:hypothetical protein